MADGKEIKNKKYTKEEINFIIENYQIHGLKYCADYLGKSKSGVGYKASELGLTIKIAYTNEEINFLIKNYPLHGIEYCSKHLGRTIKAIYVKVGRLNLRDDKHFYTKADIDFLIENYPTHGIEYCAKYLNRLKISIKYKVSVLNLKRKIYFKENHKTCTKCLIEKQFDSFGKAKTGKYGLKASCKSCLNIENTSMNIVNALSNLQPLWVTTREINGIIYEGNLNKGNKY